VAGFYRTCVIDEVLAHSPAEYVRRPNVPPESPTLGLTQRDKRYDIRSLPSRRLNGRRIGYPVIRPDSQ